MKSDELIQYIHQTQWQDVIWESQRQGAAPLQRDPFAYCPVLPYIAWKEKVDGHELWVDKDVEGDGHGLFQDAIPISEACLSRVGDAWANWIWVV